MQRNNLNDLLNSNHLHNLYTFDEMRNILMREQARSDRSTHEFSVIVFETENNINVQVFIDDLCYFLKPRLRSIDDVGWFTDNQIGIVLPYTSSENAAKFTEEIQKCIKITSHIIVVKVFTYPSIWPYKQENDQQNTHPINGSFHTTKQNIKS